jgi:hypothetical protein
MGRLEKAVCRRAITPAQVILDFAPTLESADTLGMSVGVASVRGQAL